MLVISRKTGETFLIGENIEITVLEVAGDKVRLGISAPREIRIIRKELEETECLNREAAHGNIDAATLEHVLFDRKK